MPPPIYTNLSTGEPMPTKTFLSEDVTLVFDTAVNVTEPRYIDYGIYWAGSWLYFNSWKIAAPPGLVGNILIIIVTFMIRPFTSTSFNMVALSVVDLLAICSRIPFKQLQMTSTASCKTMVYLYNALPLFSNYILLFWTIERFIAVQFPLRVMDWCTRKRAAVSLVIAGTLSVLMSVPWAYGIDVSPPGRGCGTALDKREFIYVVWYKVDAFIFIIIPMLIIFFCNILIIYRLKQSTKRHKKMTGNDESRQKREKEQRNTTITLLSVSFAFLILHTPLAVYNCMALTAIVITDPEAYAIWAFVNSFGLAMAELQNSVNFYLYFLTGRRYRQIMFRLLLPCRHTFAIKEKSSESIIKMPGASEYITGKCHNILM